MSPQHVVLIGAARSGTKLLRDALAEATGAGRVPYDIGYVWRVGHESHPDDRIDPERLSARNIRFIRRFVDRYAAGEPSAVIEKTVGNALRVPLVARVLPDAAYVHLIRDGVDVIESTRRQWTAPTELSYAVRKLRHFPLRLAPAYGLKYLRSIARRRTQSDGRVGSWGPRYPGMPQDLEEVDLLTVCSRQWRHAVTQARADLAAVDSPVVEVRYEDLVREPRAVLEGLVDRLGLGAESADLDRASADIRPTRHGAGRSGLTSTELQIIDREVGDLLEGLSYDRPTKSLGTKGTT